MKNSPPSKEPSPPLEPTLDLSDEIAAEEEEDELDVLDKEPDAEPNDPDESTSIEGRRIGRSGLDDESEFARELVEGGADLAETELRDVRELDENLEEAEAEAAESKETRR